MNAQFFDLSVPRRIHVVGIGGPGMSAIAEVLVRMGNTVSGSDIKNSESINRLIDLGVMINIGHDATVVHHCDAVTYSSAIPTTNIELCEATNKAIATLSRADILGAICFQKDSIAVAGTHGKTTTSSMLMAVLQSAQMHPSCVIGGDVQGSGTGAAWSTGKYLVVEADESDGTHEQLPLTGAILTNVDVDHLDHFMTFEQVVASFTRFLQGVQGPTVVCLDDTHIAAMSLSDQVTTYGIDSQAQVVATDISFTNGGSTFVVSVDGKQLGLITLQLRGRHNVLNALGVIAMCLRLNIDFHEVQVALGAFAGVVRRFDMRGTDGGVTFVDDYAHLPAEIAAVLTSCTDATDVWKRIVAVFQPNRFNRMSTLSDTYAHCFSAADQVVITDIYSSGTTPIDGVTGKLVVDAVRSVYPLAEVEWKSSRFELIDYLASTLREGDLCISMGCGDIQSLPDEVMQRRRIMREQS